MYTRQLTHGTFLCDDQDAHLFQGKHISESITSIDRQTPRARLKCGSLPIAHLILGVPEPGMAVDHINRDVYDNRRENLRFATRQQNNQNRKGWSEWGYKGIAPTKKADGRVYMYARYELEGVSTCSRRGWNVHDAALLWNQMAIERGGTEYTLFNDVPCWTGEGRQTDPCPTCRAVCDDCCVCTGRTTPPPNAWEGKKVNTPENYATAKGLLDQGLNRREVASQLGMAYPTFNAMLQKHGFPVLPRKRRKLTETLADEAVTLPA